MRQSGFVVELAFFQPSIHFMSSQARSFVIKNYSNDPKFWTDRFGQTVQPYIRLLLEEQSDQGPHCLLFHFHL